MKRNTKINRKHKDRLFRVVFRDKKDLLDLYNAVNNTEYTNLDDLEVNTLEDVIYLSMRNDISFLFGGMLNLYEHQSSVNPNMPMRGLLYFARLYEQYAELHGKNFYSRTLQTVPSPHYVIFYNGTEEEPDEQILRLSDAFEQCGVTGKEWSQEERPGESGEQNRTPSLECTARMLNINYGHNRAIMEKCRKLEEYAIFIACVRKYMQTGLALEAAAAQAIEDCIRQDILREILTRQKSEVIGMILHMEWEEYEELVKKEEREKGREEGYMAGQEAGRESLLIELVQQGRLTLHEAAERAEMDEESFLARMK